ncbi:MAG: hypothetical protein BGO26_04965 [Actinobacteria bacterium 69-20]|nr:MAG: hypothetical protein BGO26_04965 [Actinobacteria bacterium 69-20]
MTTVAPSAPADQALHTLEAVDVEVSFAGLRALRGVDLHVRTGEIVGLIGPNGSGKTTLLNVLSGVYRATSGTVRLDTTEMTKMATHRIAQLGIARTFQNIRLFSNMTVLQNVAVGAALSGGRPRGAALHDAAMATMTELDLTGIAYRRAVTLPYGVRRRIEIARALATEPRFLLLDEPAAGANEVESAELTELIGNIAQRHRLGILVIEHDLRLIMRVADRIVALNEGAIIAQGDAEAISANTAVREAYLGKRWAEKHSSATPPPTTDLDDRPTAPSDTDKETP